MMRETIFILAIILCSFQVIGVLGHGAMVKPSTWFDSAFYETATGKWERHTIGMKSTEMCYAGYHLDKKELCGSHVSNCHSMEYPGAACMWFNNLTHIPDHLSPTLPDHLRTFRYYAYNKPANFDWNKRNPWRAPGTAKVYSSCGVAGGNPKGCHTKDSKPSRCAFDAYGFGPKAEDFYLKFGNVEKTTWKRGSIVEAAWGITANHGGGYIYRLCKVPASGVRGITEECFQKNILAFESDKQWVQFGKNGHRIEFKADRTDVGTYPPKSVWTKNPIPACRVDHGGFFAGTTTPCAEENFLTQFQPHGVKSDGLFGYGSSMYVNGKAFPFSIVDKLKVPHNLDAGEYVLSWRWDCEQTPQVWANCASIIIE